MSNNAHLSKALSLFSTATKILSILKIPCTFDQLYLSFIDESESSDILDHDDFFTMLYLLFLLGVIEIINDRFVYNHAFVFLPDNPEDLNVDQQLFIFEQLKLKGLSHGKKESER